MIAKKTGPSAVGHQWKKHLVLDVAPAGLSATIFDSELQVICEQRVTYVEVSVVGFESSLIWGSLKLLHCRSRPQVLTIVQCLLPVSLGLLASTYIIYRRVLAEWQVIPPLRQRSRSVGEIN